MTDTWGTPYLSCVSAETDSETLTSDVLLLKYSKTGTKDERDDKGRKSRWTRAAKVHDLQCQMQLTCRSWQTVLATFEPGSASNRWVLNYELYARIIFNKDAALCFTFLVLIWFVKACYVILGFYIVRQWKCTWLWGNKTGNQQLEVRHCIHVFIIIRALDNFSLIPQFIFKKLRFLYH